jgi:hypothetical protein
MITNDEICACEIKHRTVMAKAAFNTKTLHQQTGLKELKKKLVKCYIRSDFEMLCWRSLEKISWTYCVKK